MNKGAKILLIGCGGFSVLAILAVVGFGIVVDKLMQSEASQTPADRLKIAESIVRFDMPPGYAVTTATDMALLKEVRIRKRDASREFEIVLKGSPVDNSQNQEMANALVAPLISGISNCTVKRQPDDVVQIRGKYVSFQVYGCDGRSAPRIETGSFEGNGVTVNLEAIGDENFDLDALHALLQSVR